MSPRPGGRRYRPAKAKANPPSNGAPPRTAEVGAMRRTSALALIDVDPDRDEQREHRRSPPAKSQIPRPPQFTRARKTRPWRARSKRGRKALGGIASVEEKALSSRKLSARHWRRGEIDGAGALGGEKQQHSISAPRADHESGDASIAHQFGARDKKHALWRSSFPRVSRYAIAMPSRATTPSQTKRRVAAPAMRRRTPAQQHPSPPALVRLIADMKSVQRQF